MKKMNKKTKRKNKGDKKQKYQFLNDHRHKIKFKS